MDSDNTFFESLGLAVMVWAIVSVIGLIGYCAGTSDPDKAYRRGVLDEKYGRVTVTIKPDTCITTVEP